MADDRAQEILSTWHAMRPFRTHFDTHWDQVRRFVNPIESEFLTWQTQWSQGRKTHREIYNNTAEVNSDNLTAALHQGIAPRDLEWFELLPADDELRDDFEVESHLATRAKIMHNVFRWAPGGFANEINPAIQAFIDYGNGTMMVDDRPGEGIFFVTRPVREIYILCDADYRVSQVARNWRMAARNAVRIFDKSRLPNSLVGQAENPATAEHEYEFVQLFSPNVGRDSSRRDNLNMPYIAETITVQGTTVVDERGYHEMPLIHGRWQRKRNELYGRGQGMKALGDVRMLQRTERVALRGKEKHMDPPWMIADDGITGGKDLNVGPSGQNMIRAEYMMGRGDPIRQLGTGGQPQIADNEIERIEKRIEALYYYNIITLLQDPRMTATQVLALGEAVQQLMGPNIDRIEQEFLDPILFRVHNILNRAGAFPQAPDQLRGRRIRIKYTGPIARARRAARATGILRTVDMVAGMTAIKEDVRDNFDLDGAARDAAELMGWPLHRMRDPEDVAQMRLARAAALAQQAQFERTNEALNTGANVMKALPAAKDALGGEGEAAA